MRSGAEWRRRVKCSGEAVLGLALVVDGEKAWDNPGAGRKLDVDGLAVRYYYGVRLSSGPDTSTGSVARTAMRKNVTRRAGRPQE